ncbi:MAG: cupin domain-containing protein [Flavobacteriales bacterium]|nr:cupin domain-containing protein [Flavobacteriales bacterium]
MKKHYTYPHTITNKHGETLTFKSIELEDGIEKMIVENELIPNSGPPMHVHFKQSESLTVTEGEMTYQVLGQEPVVCKVGETATFEAGVAHKFWNSGESNLKCVGWVKPANSLDFFLTEMYRSVDEGDGERPEPFSSAYLMTRYKSEYDMLEIPGFIKKVIVPITYLVGKLTGKYARFANAPEPLK